MYEAIITPLINLRQHPNADRLLLANAAGYQVVVGKDTQEGILGAFFPCDGQLSHAFCSVNNLYRHADLNFNPKAKTGFFDDNRRVRAQKFRGEISEGFWIELNKLAFTGQDLSTLKENTLFTKLNEVLICSKYYTKATMQAMVGKKKTRRSKKGFNPDSIPSFAEHWDTKQLRMMISHIPEDAILYLSAKCHGTSGRTGHLVQEKNLNWFQRFWNKSIGKLGLAFKDHKWIIVSGTRRVVLDPFKTDQRGYYSGTTFRSQVHQKFVALKTPRNITWYYEIVGFDDNKKPIMPPHPIEDPNLKKIYGDTMIYRYGCLPGQHKVLVYRITIATDEGRIFDLPVQQIKQLCKYYGLETVPYLEGPFQFPGKEALVRKCKALSDGPDPIDSTHIREGIVIRVEAEHITDYKYKGDTFSILEGIAKNSDFFVDTEEIS